LIFGAVVKPPRRSHCSKCRQLPADKQWADHTERPRCEAESLAPRAIQRSLRATVAALILAVWPCGKVLQKNNDVRIMRQRSMRRSHSAGVRQRRAAQPL